MEDKTRNSMKISGAGSFSGGAYSDVSISGSGSVNGDLDCISLRVSGSSRVNGNVKAESIKISGSTHIKGEVYADELKISGGTHVENNVTVKELKISGSTDIDGSVSAEEVRVSGSIKIKGDTNAEMFSSSGAFKIGGLLNAGVVDVTLYGESQVTEIGGEKINIRKEAHNKVFRFIQSLFPYSPSLKVETIEGDDIYVEFTKAKVVRGSNVKIGPGCEIGLVEYKDSFEQDSQSEVKENRRLE